MDNSNLVFISNSLFYFAILNPDSLNIYRPTQEGSLYLCCSAFYCYLIMSFIYVFSVILCKCSLDYMIFPECGVRSGLQLLSHTLPVPHFHMFQGTVSTSAYMFAPYYAEVPCSGMCPCKSLYIQDLSQFPALMWPCQWV